MLKPIALVAFALLLEGAFVLHAIVAFPAPPAAAERAAPPHHAIRPGALAAGPALE